MRKNDHIKCRLTLLFLMNVVVSINAIVRLSLSIVDFKIIEENKYVTPIFYFTHFSDVWLACRVIGHIIYWLSNSGGYFFVKCNRRRTPSDEENNPIQWKQTNYILIKYSSTIFKTGIKQIKRYLSVYSIFMRKQIQLQI